MVSILLILGPSNSIIQTAFWKIISSATVLNLGCTLESPGGNLNFYCPDLTLFSLNKTWVTVARYECYVCLFVCFFQNLPKGFQYTVKAEDALNG